MKARTFKGKFLYLTILTILASCASSEPDTRPGERRYLTVTKNGSESLRKVDVTRFEPGEDMIEIPGSAGYLYPWQGQDSIDYRIVDKNLWVNDTLVGIYVDSSHNSTGIDIESLPQPNRILAISCNSLVLPVIARLTEQPVSLYIYNPRSIPFETASANHHLLSEFKSLRGLYYEGEGVTDSLLICASSLEKLTELHVITNHFISRAENEKMSTSGFVKLSELNELRTLRMVMVRVYDKDLELLCRLKNLRCLLIVGLRATDRGMKSLSNLTELRFLELWYLTNVKGRGLRHLAKLEKLDYLILIHPNIDRWKLNYWGKKVERKLPGCRVIVKR